MAGKLEWMHVPAAGGFRPEEDYQMKPLRTVPAAADAPALPPLHVLVRFGAGVPGDKQGPALLAFERALREAGVSAEVFKETAPDDSKLRRNMTDEQREAL